MPQQNTPNLVFVITDDQGYGDLGCTGNPVINTPNLDALADQSVQLQNLHVGPTCSPTRAGIMTGHYCNSTGVWHTIGGRSLLRTTRSPWQISSGATAIRPVCSVSGTSATITRSVRTTEVSTKHSTTVAAGSARPRTIGATTISMTPISETVPSNPFNGYCTECLVPRSDGIY